MRKASILTTIFIFVLITSMALPFSARAEGDPPPDGTTGSGETDTSESQPVAESPTQVEQPAVESSLMEVVPANLIPTDFPLPVDPTIVENVLSDDEQLSIPEVLDALPDETTITVIDESGQAVPLTTQESADIFIDGDPMWCPEGVLPGGAGCTQNFRTMQGLITYIQNPGNNISGAGTIYLAYNYTGYGDPATIVFDPSTMQLTNLTIQGGWDFSPSVNASVGTSTIAKAIQIGTSTSQWNGSLTLTDLVLNNTSDTAININAAGPVFVNNVSVSGGGGDGIVVNSNSTISIDNVSVTGKRDGLRTTSQSTTNVTNSHFNSNTNLGGSLSSNSLVNVSNSTFNQNGAGGGAEFWGSGAVSVSNSNFDNNTGVGVAFRPGGTVSVNGITASNNGGFGISVNSEGNYDHPAVSITNTTANNNNGGVYINSLGSDITLTNVTVLDNASLGADIINADFAASISINNSNFGNNDIGLRVQNHSLGDIMLNNVTAQGNADRGGVITADNSGITVNGSDFSNNGVLGAEFHTWSNSSVTASNSIFSGNGSAAGGPSTANADGSGLFVESGGNISLNNITAQNNANAGLYLNTSAQTQSAVTIAVNGGGAIVDCGTVSGNAYGVVANVADGVSGATGDGTLVENNVNFSNNTFGNTIMLSGTLVNVNVACGAAQFVPLSNPGGGTPGGGGGTSGGSGQTNPPMVSLFGAAPAMDTVLPGQVVPLVCQANGGSTAVSLEDGTTVIFGCPTGDAGILDLLPEGGLPGKMPEDSKFGESLNVKILLNNFTLPPMKLDGTVEVIFPIPPESAGKKFAIWFWDPSMNEGQGGWVELPKRIVNSDGTEKTFPLRDPADDMSILVGVYEDAGMVRVKTNFPGIFMLVTQ